MSYTAIFNTIDEAKAELRAVFTEQKLRGRSKEEAAKLNRIDKAYSDLVDALLAITPGTLRDFLEANALVGTMAMYYNNPSSVDAATKKKLDKLANSLALTCWPFGIFASTMRKADPELLMVYLD